jgi:hypothetical protein
MATAELKNRAGLNDIYQLLLQEMAVLNRKMHKNRFSVNRCGDHVPMPDKSGYKSLYEFKKKSHPERQGRCLGFRPNVNFFLAMLALIRVHLIPSNGGSDASGESHGFPNSGDA